MMMSWQRIKAVDPKVKAYVRLAHNQPDFTGRIPDTHCDQR